MATKKQIAANRRNAQKSTGPRTPEGKQAVSMNALKSGLDAESQFINWEERAEFAALQASYTQRYQPLNLEERFQVDRMLRAEWFTRRLFRAESELWNYQMSLASPREDSPLGAAFTSGSPIFMRLQRRLDRQDRIWSEAYAELLRLQARPMSDRAPEIGELVPLRNPLFDDDPLPAPATPPQPSESTQQTEQLALFRNLPPDPAADLLTPPPPPPPPSQPTPIPLLSRKEKKAQLNEMLRTYIY